MSISSPKAEVERRPIAPMGVSLTIPKEVVGSQSIVPMSLSLTIPKVEAERRPSLSLIIPEESSLSPITQIKIRGVQATIHDALEQPDPKVVFEFMKTSPKEAFNVKGPGRQLPLLEAARVNQPGVVEAMVDKMDDQIHRKIEEGDIFFGDDYIGGTYFHVMLGEIKFYDPACIDYLIKAGLDPKLKNKEDKDGKNPLTLMFSSMLFAREGLAFQKNWEVIFDFLSRVSKEDRDHLIKEALEFVEGEGYPLLASELEEVFKRDSEAVSVEESVAIRTAWIDQCKVKSLKDFQNDEGPEGQLEELAVVKLVANACGIPHDLRGFPEPTRRKEKHSAFGMPDDDDRMCRWFLDVVNDAYSLKDDATRGKVKDDATRGKVKDDATRGKVKDAFHHAATMSKQVADSNKSGAAPPFLTDEYVTAVREGDIQVMRLGWKEHVITVTFFNGYMVIGNGGSRPDKRSTLTVFKIDLKLVTKDLLLAMVAQSSRPEEEGIEFFYTELPKLLDALREDGSTKQDKITLAIEKMSPKEQKWGNCPFFSLNNAASRVVLFAIEYRKTGLVNAKQIEAIIAKAKSLSTEVRVRFYLSYLARHGIKPGVPRNEKEIEPILRASKRAIQLKAKESALVRKLFNAQFASATVAKITERVTKQPHHARVQEAASALLTGPMGGSLSFLSPFDWWK